MNGAPTLPTACGSLPPEGALRLWPGKAGSTAPAGLESRCSTFLEGAGRLPMRTWSTSTLSSAIFSEK